MFFGQMRDSVSYPVGLGRLLGTFFGAGALVLADGLFTQLDFLTSFDFAVVIAAQIQADLKQPGTKARPFLKRFALAIDPEKGLLKDVVSNTGALH